MTENNPFKRPPATADGDTLADGRDTRTRRGGRHRLPLAAVAPVAAALVLAGCGTVSAVAPGSPPPSAEATQEAASVTPRLVATYAGGVMVIDAATGETVLDEPLAGFNRLNPAGDGRHVLVSSAGGFRVLDSGAWSVPHGDHDHHYTTAPELTGDVFPATEPGHVVRHGGQTILFDDGTGHVTTFDPAELSDGMPETSDDAAATAHHGLAIELDDGTLLMTEGTADSRTGIIVSGPVDPSGARPELARSTDCPGVHGAAVAANEAVAFGCEDGMLIYRDGKISKVDSPTAYGRVGNHAGSEQSSVILGDYKSDPDAELERPTRVSLTDTATGTMRLVDIGASYSFRSLARGPEGEALVLGTDGDLRVIDPDTGETISSIPVTGPWKEPLQWQQPRPTLTVQEGIAYVTEPATRKIHLVDVASAHRLASYDLPHEPNELTSIPG